MLDAVTTFWFMSSCRVSFAPGLLVVRVSPEPTTNLSSKKFGVVSSVDTLIRLFPLAPSAPVAPVAPLGPDTDTVHDVLVPLPPVVVTLIVKDVPVYVVIVPCIKLAVSNVSTTSTNAPAVNSLLALTVNVFDPVPIVLLVVEDDVRRSSLKSVNSCHFAAARSVANVPDV